MPRDKSLMGAKQKWDYDFLKEELMELPLTERTTFRQMSDNLDMPKTTLFRGMQEHQVFRRHTSSLKPSLREDNKMARIAYCMDSVKRDPNGTLYYDPSYDVVHVDEKWFFLTEEGKQIYLAEGEKIPERETKNKGHITKVSFPVFGLCFKLRSLT